MIPFNMGLNTDKAVEQETVTEAFEGYVECPLFAQECRIVLETDGLVFAGRFQQVDVMYGEITAIHLADYLLTLTTDSGRFTISRMGQKLQWLYEKLYAAYNDAVLEALKITGIPLLEVTGEYIAEEEGMVHRGPAQIRLYEECLCILPPNENARRLPLCFLKHAGIRDYTYEMELNSGEKVRLSRLGRELDILDQRLTEQLHKLGEKTLSWQKEVAPGINSMQAASAAGLMPYGRGAKYQKIAETAPRLATAIETHVKESRMAKTYPWLVEMCGGDCFWTGILPAPEKTSVLEGLEIMQKGELDLSKLPELINSGNEGAGSEAAEEKESPVILWLLVPDKEQQIVAVELSLAEKEAAATYLYRISGTWEEFAVRIDRALEASSFDRQLIRMPEEELKEPEHLKKRMLIKRTPTLEMLRKQFVGRAIHTSWEHWKKDIENCCRNTVNTFTGNKQVTEKHCATCGAELSADAKFCGQCGTRAI